MSNQLSSFELEEARNREGDVEKKKTSLLSQVTQRSVSPRVDFILFLRECGNEEREEDWIIGRAELTTLFLREEDCPLLAGMEKWCKLFLQDFALFKKLFGPRLNNLEDRTKTRWRPVLPILWNQRSRFSPVDRHSFGLCPSIDRTRKQNCVAI